MCRSLDPQTEKMIQQLPRLATEILNTGRYLYEKVVEVQIKEYDAHYGSQVMAQIDALKQEAMIQSLIGFMLYVFYKELLEGTKDTRVPVALGRALHFELYEVSPDQNSFLDYLNYQNPHFENPAMAPTFKFGNDIAQIVGIRDLSFAFAMAQQAPLIDTLSRKVIRLTLFGEPMVPPAVAAS